MNAAETRNRIDQIWDVFWNGGTTNSVTIVEQMTYLFFMKMLDDAQILAERNARAFHIELDNATFPEGKRWKNPETKQEVPYHDLRWSTFMTYTSPDMLYSRVRNDVFVFIKNLGTGIESAYSRYMQNAVFLIENPRTLIRILEGINELDMKEKDTMGDVYEYMLKKMAASGNNGQFRTPRHIIEMMVHLVKPTIDDEICDPAMGSAGFIVESVKYIKWTHPEAEMSATELNRFRGMMFHGFDTDTTMLRIGAMNLMLHGVEAPDVKWQDSVSEENHDTDRYSICLANPPFSGSIDGQSIAKTLTSIVPTKKTELLFLALFVRMLRTGGKCASIVPDGVLFGTSAAHKAIRKELVDNQMLQAVISMPAGVFYPYSPVSTGILVFTKTNAGGTDKVWFYDMKADGYSLDQKRAPIADNDIPDIEKRFNNLQNEESRTRKDQSFLVSVDDIRANDYILSVNKYKEVSREKVAFESSDVILKRIMTSQESITESLKEFESKFSQM